MQRRLRSVLITVMLAPMWVVSGTLKMMAHADEIPGVSSEESASLNSYYETVVRLTDQAPSLNGDDRAGAYFTLGELRATRAIHVLVNDITFSPPRFSDGIGQRPIPWSRYPAFEALCKIGSEAVPALVDKIASSDNSLEQQLAQTAIRAAFSSTLIDKSRFDHGRYLSAQALTLAARSETDPKRAERLKKAADSMSSMIKPENAP